MSNSNKPLRQNVAVIKSAVVKPEPPPYAEFDRFTELGEKLAECLGKINKLADGLMEADVPEVWQINTAENYLKERPKVEKMVAQFRAAEKYYDRDELYDKPWGGKRPGQIAESFVSDQLTLLVGAFPNSVPHSPEVFTKMLFEEVKAYNPLAIPLESACRVLRRTKTFVPTIAETLKALKHEESRWGDHFEAGGADDHSSNILDCLSDLADVVAEAKAKQAAETEKIEAAYKAGREARANGMRRCPPDYHGDRRTKALVEAWNEGFDDEGAAC